MEEKKILIGSWDDLKNWPDIAASTQRAKKYSRDNAQKTKKSAPDSEQDLED